MSSFKLTKLDGIDDQTNVAIASEPCTVVLVVNLVSVANAVFHDASVTTHVQNRWQGLSHFRRPIQIRGHIQSRHRLEVQLFDHHVVLANFACHGRVQFAPFWHRVQSQHVQQLLPVHRSLARPVLQILDVRE